MGSPDPSLPHQPQPHVGGPHVGQPTAAPQTGAPQPGVPQGAPQPMPGQFLPSHLAPSHPVTPQPIPAQQGQPVVGQPVMGQPVVGQYPYQQPGYGQQPAYPQQPAYGQQQAYAQPVYQQGYPQQPVYQQPATQNYPQQAAYPQQQPYPQQPVYQQPAALQPAHPQQAYPQQAYPQQVYPQPTYPQQGYGQAYPQQGYGQPSQPQATVAQPAYPSSGYAQPSFSQPAYAQPSVVQPSVAQPAYTHPQPVQPQHVAAPTPAPPTEVAPVYEAEEIDEPVSEPVALENTFAEAADSPQASAVAEPTAAPRPARPARPSNRPRPIPAPAVGAAAPAATVAPSKRPVPTRGDRPAPAPAAAENDPSRPRISIKKRREEEEEEEAGLAPEMDEIVRRSPPWLVSAIVHMSMLLVLGLGVLATKDRSGVQLEAVMLEPEPEIQEIYAEQLGEQIIDDSISIPVENPDPNVTKQVWVPGDLPEVDDPFAASPSLSIANDALKAMSSVTSDRIGIGALAGREIGTKTALLGRYGGTKTTESAVVEGLKWLQKNQHKDGNWSLQGPYTNGASFSENELAATAMALLAFQGGGHTHVKGDFRETVAKGWEWLLKQQDADGNFFKSGAWNHRLYSQAQCTIALCELYGMTKDDKFRDPAERAIKYAVRIQDSLGGWKYVPGQDSDMSVTGWFVMALQSARMAYLEVPDSTLDKVSKYLDKVGKDEGRYYSYQIGESIKVSMTAEALLCRQYLGWKRNDPRLIDGVKYILDRPMRWDDDTRDAYYWYYATQVCHHMEGEAWDKWNGVMRQMLPEKQIKKGPEAGSWDPRGDQWGPHGGRLYVTCLHIYMLEVYYRHLPIYGVGATTARGGDL